MADASKKRAVLIAGPTASGKSALALARARELGGVVVNADAMQVYAGLRVVTARPAEAETAKAPHRLYGVVDPSVRFSTGAWLAAAGQAIEEAEGRPLIFVGGTGLYFEALERGFAEVPPIPPEIVAEVSGELAGLDATGRAALLRSRDPEMAARLRAPDPQRVARALAVLKATGRSLAGFQDQEGGQRGLLGGFDIERIVLNPDRDVLRQRIANRFAGMLAQGAVEEVSGLLARGLDPSLPAMKAIGVREIGRWLAGEISEGEAVELAVIATRQYAKRQRTWFRAHMAGWDWIDPLAGA
jgi:tRNA dimethylallyltransferase